MHTIDGNLSFNGASLQSYGLNNFLEKLIAMILDFNFTLKFHKLIKYKNHFYFDGGILVYEKSFFKKSYVLFANFINGYYVNRVNVLC